MDPTDDELNAFLDDDGDWVALEAYPGYFVSEGGNIWSVARGEVKRLEPWVNPHGYQLVRLSTGWSRKTLYVHELVALAFLGPRPKGAVIRHLDGNSLHNVPSNLRYGTKSENALDASAQGSLMKGSRHVNARVSELDVRWIRCYHSLGFTHVAISRVFMIAPATCADIIKRRTWAHVT